MTVLVLSGYRPEVMTITYIVSFCPTSTTPLHMARHMDNAHSVSKAFSLFSCYATRRFVAFLEVS